MGALNKIKSIKLCLMAHPDNEQDSEFADRISDLEAIETNFSEMFEFLRDLYEQEQCVSQSYHDELFKLLTKITEQ